MARHLTSLIALALVTLPACLLDTTGRFQPDTGPDADDDECIPTAEVCNGLDDDCDDAIDEDFDLLTSAEHCGSCDRVCRDAHATSVACEDGECVYECQDNFAPCENSLGQRACEYILSDTRCGDCTTSCNADGRVCSAEGGTPHCAPPPG
jgi:hypothetical protein